MGAIEQKHGRPTTSKLVQALGALFRSAARPSDLAGRCGDDELMLVLPGTNRATAAAIAESIRRAIAAKPLECGSEKLPVTGSIGVACFEPGGLLKDAAHLLKAAKLAVDAAKQAGRNRVRIFFPKTQLAA
jgi:diguanylate cyclase (GGDEF)-like protein